MCLFRREYYVARNCERNNKIGTGFLLCLPYCSFATIFLLLVDRRNGLRVFQTEGLLYVDLEDKKPQTNGDDDDIGIM